MIGQLQEVRLTPSLKFYKKINIQENNRKCRYKLALRMYQTQTVTLQVQRYLTIPEKMPIFNLLIFIKFKKKTNLK